MNRQLLFVLARNAISIREQADTLLNVIHMMQQEEEARGPSEDSPQKEEKTPATFGSDD